VDIPKTKDSGPSTGGSKLGPPIIGCYGGIRIRSRLAKLRQRHSFPDATSAVSNDSALLGIAISSSGMPERCVNRSLSGPTRQYAPLINIAHL